MGLTARDVAGMKTTAAMGVLVALCCGAHFFVIPLLAAGALTGVVGGLGGQPGPVVAGVVLVAAAVIAVTIRWRASRSARATYNGALPGLPGAGKTDRSWRCS